MMNDIQRITHFYLIFVTFFFCLLFNFSIVNSQESTIFWHLRTIGVTPDSNFQTGSFSRINYVPATGNFVVTFGTTHDDSPGLEQGAGYAYKEYTTDMLETGKTSTITWFPGLPFAGDAGSVMIDNTYYFVDLPTDTIGFEGWRMFKFDAINWTIIDEIYIPLLFPQEKNNDPMVAYVNGLLDISSQYDALGPPPPLEEGAATHHHFFSTDLGPAGLRILNDTPHVCGSSMIFVDGIYYMVTSDAFLGDLIVMKYDENWQYLGKKMLIPMAHWSQGLVCDGERFYISYLSTSQRTPVTGLPVHLNVHLAAFDLDWNLLEDIAVTNFQPEDNKQPGRPWIILHDYKLYVSYDQDTVDAITGEEQLQWQAYVSIYELNPNFNSVENFNTVSNGFQLEQNYPNPFNPQTSISFIVQKNCHVILKVHNILGKEISTLINEDMPAGKYKAMFNGEGLPSGIYLYTIQIGDYNKTEKMLLSR